MTRISKAVFPVTSFGSRFLPATKAMPKELLPIVDKPLIQYAAEEATAAGVDTLIFVTGRNKPAIEDHFDANNKLETMIYADTFGTGQVSEEQIEKAVSDCMDLTPRGIRTHLGLNKPIYQRTAAYGHFGRAPDADGGFSWERTDLIDALKAAVY